MSKALALLALAAAAALGPAPVAVPGGRAPTRLGIQGTQFTVNGEPTFLLGLSYYGALGAADEALRSDLKEMKRRGFNWLRVWATWAAFGNDVSAVDGQGQARAPYLARLRKLVADCDRMGLIVDVTLSRGNGVTGPPRLLGLDAHRRAVATLVAALRPHRNWYLDLSNERNVKDRRFTSFADLAELRALVRKLDSGRLVTASHAGDIAEDELREYVKTAGVDFLTPHRPRDPKSPAQTEARTHAYLASLKGLGREVPVHYQEPFRRGFGKYRPRAEDYRTDALGARAGGAAGWCFHNGDERARADGRPRRSFDLRDGRLFDQLDAEERAALNRLLPFPKTK
jgi:endo-1,4-beta-mannosidase